MNPLPPRLVIYAKDVMNITGRSERTAQKLLADIRKKLEKPPHAFISTEEFCRYTGLKEEKVSAFLI
ncbi:MAG: hypothetical protein ACO1OO_04350 [Flavisolibacter sp.]